MGNGEFADISDLYRYNHGYGGLGMKKLGIIFLLTLIEKMLLAAIPAAGFAMVFNVPVRALKYCALLWAIGYGFRMILMEMSFSIECASFVRQF